MLKITFSSERERHKPRDGPIRPISREKFFESAPESPSPGRQSSTGSTMQPPGRSASLAMTGAELRLRAWSELPERHRNEVCNQIRKRCEAFMTSIRVERVERKSETDRLVSEVVAHLLRATSVHRDDTAMDRTSPGAAPTEPTRPGGPSPSPRLGGRGSRRARSTRRMRAGTAG
jgi:hypothetical protein